jgi:flagellar biosynthesis/type III secretory pathway M-ring protein FliF/YscJ
VARLIELLFFAFVFYMLVRRIAAPFRRGYAERERERAQDRAMRRQKKEAPKIDRSGMKDAEFKDL